MNFTAIAQSSKMFSATLVWFVSQHEQLKQEISIS